MSIVHVYQLSRKRMIVQLSHLALKQVYPKSWLDSRACLREAQSMATRQNQTKGPKVQFNLIKHHNTKSQP